MPPAVPSDQIICSYWGKMKIQFSEVNSKHWPQPVAWRHPYFIHRQGPQERGIALALQCLYLAYSLQNDTISIWAVCHFLVMIPRSRKMKLKWRRRFRVSFDRLRRLSPFCQWLNLHVCDCSCCFTLACILARSLMHAEFSYHWD